MITLPLGSILASTLVLAAASGGPPKVNIEATCRTSEIEIKKIFGDDTKVTTSGCLMQENAALDELAMTWSTFSSADKASCVQPRSYMPSYVEWLTCLEMEQQVNELRKRAATNPATTEGRGARAGLRPSTPADSRGPRIGSEAKPCPVVQFGSDGSITSMVAC